MLCGKRGHELHPWVPGPPPRLVGPLCNHPYCATLGGLQNEGGKGLLSAIRKRAPTSIPQEGTWPEQKERQHTTTAP